MKYLYTFVFLIIGTAILAQKKTPLTNDFVAGSYPIFGKGNEKIPLQSRALKNATYYLISGHGGPDPGAMATYNGSTLCEDEYAYDITLRLAKKLIANGAKVYLIVRDEKDGIRNGEILLNTQREICYTQGTMPLNQLDRLNQRTQVVNKLYDAQPPNRYQRLIEIHIDSRSETQQTDLYFYHLQGSEMGNRLAQNLHQTFDQNYAEHQKGRGYSGTIATRNLYTLKATKPYAVYIEVGNIQNEFDLRRIVIDNNRQALANWLCEGLIKDFEQEK
jgi:N-acetylmuramoyl-L-alanine amidase